MMADLAAVKDLVARDWEPRDDELRERVLEEMSARGREQMQSAFEAIRAEFTSGDLNARNALCGGQILGVAVTLAFQDVPTGPFDGLVHHVRRLGLDREPTLQDVARRWGLAGTSLAEAFDAVKLGLEPGPLEMARRIFGDEEEEA